MLSRKSQHNTNNPLLEVKGLKKYFDVTEKIFTRNKQYLKAVDGLDFSVFEGETLGIVGESGCGKSTAGKLIVQLMEPTEGKVYFEGKDLGALSNNELRNTRKDFQIIFQDPFSSLNPRSRVFDIVAEPLVTHNIVSGKDLKKRVKELIEVVGLNENHINRFPHEFSGGQRQRVGIARALALNPKLIVCDEPVSALDVSIQSQILNLLKRLQEDFNLTYIFIAHGLPAVKHISDRIAVMYLGKIVEIASKEKLFNDTKHPYTEGLLSAVPIPDPKKRNKKNRVILKGDMPSPVNPPTGCPFHTRCKYATSKCKTDVPELKEHVAGHFVSCHYPLESKDKI